MTRLARASDTTTTTESVDDTSVEVRTVSAEVRDLVEFTTLDGRMVYADTTVVTSPADGDTVSSPVTVRFGLKNMGVAPAGTVKEKTGHHHLIIDAPLPDLGKPIPANEHYIHFGGGQTQTTVELSPGGHTLQLLLGDHAHMPHAEPVYSDVVTITVE